MPSGPISRIKLSQDEAIRQLLEARQSAKWQWINAILWSRVFSFLHLGLVLATIGLGIAQTVYASRGEASLWPGIASTAVGSILALIRGTGLPDRVYEVLYDVDGWISRCDQFTLKRSLRLQGRGTGGKGGEGNQQGGNRGAGGNGPANGQGTAAGEGEEGEQGEVLEGARIAGFAATPDTAPATITATRIDTNIYWKTQGQTKAEEDKSAMEYSDALMADWAKIMGRLQQAELRAWTSIAGYGKKKAEGTVNPA